MAEELRRESPFAMPFKLMIGRCRWIHPGSRLAEPRELRQPVLSLDVRCGPRPRLCDALHRHMFRMTSNDLGRAPTSEPACWRSTVL